MLPTCLVKLFWNKVGGGQRDQIPSTRCGCCVRRHPQEVYCCRKHLDKTRIKASLSNSGSNQAGSMYKSHDQRLGSCHTRQPNKTTYITLPKKRIVAAPLLRSRERWAVEVAVAVFAPHSFPLSTEGDADRHRSTTNRVRGTQRSQMFDSLQVDLSTQRRNETHVTTLCQRLKCCRAVHYGQTEGAIPIKRLDHGTAPCACDSTLLSQSIGR